MGAERNISNEEVAEIKVEIPEGHYHLRTTIKFVDGTSLTFQEATVANLVRAFIDVKTHPTKTRATLKGRPVSAGKKGYAKWQLIEEEEA